MTGIPPSARSRHPRWNPRVTLGAQPQLCTARVPPYLQAFRGELVSQSPSDGDAIHDGSGVNRDSDSAAIYAQNAADKPEASRATIDRGVTS
jgi:hypothetical protein